MEAEYIALLYEGVKAWWYWNLFTKLGFPQTELIMIRSDSLDLIIRLMNPYLTHSLQHIDLKWNIVQQLVIWNLIIPEAC